MDEGCSPDCPGKSGLPITEHRAARLGTWCPQCIVAMQTLDDAVLTTEDAIPVSTARLQAGQGDDYAPPCHGNT